MTPSSPGQPRSPFVTAVLTIVGLIPAGRVLTYGDVATLAGHPRAARAVGGILRALTDDELPWHRVVNAAGGISVGGDPSRPLRQIRWLQAEGIAVARNGTLDLTAARWPLLDAASAATDAGIAVAVRRDDLETV